MKIKFVTGFSGFGGSTIALIEHCKLLDSAGYDVEFYGNCDWHLDRYYKSKLKKDLVIEEDDILVYHFEELETRPACKKCFLYIHEQDLFDLKTRKISGFDKILFVSESQKEFHKEEGIVIPNPIFNLVDKKLNNPPDKNIAGVVGTIQTRKQQHVSIKKAIEDGCEKVLIFGDKEDGYFKEYVEPLLSEKVVYMGLVDPEKRMDMYNQFDVLYNFSLDESASLVLGECKILGKRIVKSKEVKEYDIVLNSSIVKKWQIVFEGSEIIDKLVCVITHKRIKFIDKWLRAWNNCNKLGCKIAVLHAYDGSEPNEEEKQNILKHSPDYYVPLKNDPDLKDLLAIESVVRRKLPLPEWEYLFWFTDDMLPMRKSFLEPFMKIKKGGVGLTAQCYEPRGLPESHIRTVAYAITRDVGNRLNFPNESILTVAARPKCEWPYLFEYGKTEVYGDHILKQVMSMGYDFELCHSQLDDDYMHWTSFVDWMWDCDLLKDWDLEGVYEEQFSKVEKITNITPRKETLISLEDFEEKSLISNKICAIIPTSTAPIENLIWSVFSLLLRSDPNVLEHIVVAINGPDSRTGDPEIQNKKQAFIEDLRSLKWNDKDMPITLIRTWSRIGHAQTIEQCIPWAHTEFYLCMHDDIIVLDDKWADKTSEFKENKKMLLACWGRPIFRKLYAVDSERLELPHFSSIFTLCKKSRMKAINANWIGYYIPFEFQIENVLNYEDFINWYKKNNLIDKVPPKESVFKFLTMDIGGAFVPEIFNKKLTTPQFKEDTIFHFGSMSWCDDERKKKISESTIPQVISLEKQIIKNESYWNLYKKYTKPRIEKKYF